MIESASTAVLPFTLHLAHIEHDFKVLAFEGTERISEPYQFKIQVVSEKRDLPLSSYLHQQAFLRFGVEDNGVHGQIHSIARGESGKRQTHYEVTLVPHIAYLQHSYNQRIFQRKSVPEIIAQVLAGHNILEDAFRFSDGPMTCPAREYCVQYDESDLNFIQRLCAEEGIHYHFQHSKTGHTLVFGDHQNVFPALQPALFHPECGMALPQPTVKRFSVRLQTRTSRVARRDYVFTQSRLRMEATFKGDSPDSGDGEPNLEDYRYPGQFEKRARGELLARRALERHRHDYQLAVGTSDVPYLLSGHYLDLKDHPTTDYNHLWLLIRIHHEGRQPQVLTEAFEHLIQKDGFAQGYRNNFEATPWDVFFRPPLNHLTPYVRGSQSAVVTGPAGEEIHCDEYGRVKVQFHWHREGNADEHSSCWMRVASNWTGEAYGSMVIPRVGMEVVVSFWDGCPDRPYISGCVVNSSNRPPYPLPSNKTRSVFKTLSYPGGGGSNALGIEDRKGREHIRIQAERDWDQLIKHNQTLHIGHERHDTVVANSYTEHKAEEHRTTHANRVIRVGAADHLDVGQSRHVKTGVGHYLDAGQEIHCKAGSKVVIEAGAELTLSAGGSTITLNPGGIWINGAAVALNSGGSPAVGSGAQLLPALPPGAALQQLPGAVPKPALANIQSTLMRNAADNGESRCLICEACRENACALPPCAA
jgi:type VI secretion system secreted protein VgrG